MSADRQSKYSVSGNIYLNDALSMVLVFSNGEVINYYCKSL